ncbi:deoxynucleoside kinase [Mycoplasma hafezii]|uniref:deoxynucleoside kinase n=1 Tax=Mycoplasma hafezii TaxID=525886 RepID=UPI003CFA9564
MLIGISGMIGSGKSVLSQKLAKHYKNKALLLQEFAEEDDVFNKMLEWFYERRKNFDITFQAYAIEHHLGAVSDIKAEFQKRKMDENEDLILIDRFVAEHYVFATVNLENCKDKFKKAYDGFFYEIVQPEDLPEFAIFLDVSMENFKKRLFKRGRQVEIDAWDANKDYFEKLLSIYKETFTTVAKKYNIEFVVIDTNNLTEAQVYKTAVELIENYKEGKKHD